MVESSEVYVTIIVSHGRESGSHCRLEGAGLVVQWQGKSLQQEGLLLLETS